MMERFTQFVLVLIKFLEHFQLLHAQGDTVRELNIMAALEDNYPNYLDYLTVGKEEAEKMYEGDLKMNIFSMINDMNEEITPNNSSFCTARESGLSFFVDLSWSQLMRPAEINQLGIAYIRLDLNVRPFYRVLTDYIHARNGNDVIMIFQNAIDTDDGIYTHIQMAGHRTIIFDGLSSENVKRIRKIRPSPSYFAIFADTPNMNRLFKMAIDNDLVRRPDQWNLVFMDFKWTQFAYQTEFTQVSRIVMDTSVCCKWAMLADAGCTCPDDFTLWPIAIKETVKHIVKTFDENRIVASVTPCNVPSYSFERRATKTMAMLQKSVDSSELIRIDDTDVLLRLNFSIFANDKSINATNSLIKIASHRDGRIIEELKDQIKPSRKMFRISSVEAIPWAQIKRDTITQERLRDNNGRYIWEGYCIDLMAELAVRMDFDYEIVLPKSGRFGKQTKGKWDGIVGDLMRGETDMAVAPVKMTAEREEVIDFVVPYFEQTGISIVIRQPVRQTSLFKFMTVLRLEVWLSIVGAIVVTSVMMWLLDKYSPYSARNNKAAYPYDCREFSLKECFWFALTSFTPQGGGETPKALSGRTLVASYWLFVVLMLATFTANLAAFLTVERMQTPVQSLEQLARQQRINYTVVQHSDTHQYFINMKFAEDTLYEMWRDLVLKSTSDQIEYRVWDYPIREQYGHILLSINASQPVSDAAEGFRKVNDHVNADFAFIHDAAEIKYEISRNCNLTEVGEVFAEQPYAIAVPQGSYLQDKISRNILELQKLRYFDELSARYWNKSARGECDNTDDNEGISLESLGGVFIATLAGLGIAMACAVVEIFIERRNARKTGSARIGPTAKEVLAIKAFGERVTADYPEPPDYESTEYGTRPPVTIGNEFVPASAKNISYVSVFKRSNTENAFYH